GSPCGSGFSVPGCGDWTNSCRSQSLPWFSAPVDRLHELDPEADAELQFAVLNCAGACIKTGKHSGIVAAIKEVADEDRCLQVAALPRVNPCNGRVCATDVRGSGLICRLPAPGYDNHAEYV